ncbi:MAG: segregation/condensation protein A [Deltaproteobacteria bacterium]|nr:segregation/condensation protein A [Deltaproteobacteria bacterium]MBW2139881.1 segregation/condensation protein A [Deltaproteobacteria bacterium]MBW2323210.1 segregation/condensation protein A [Deltaproteobacteria bacterium]
MSLSVKLEIYEGPLDLLLHLIKKHEVDIYDIPIALITTQYLEYLKLIESFNIELAGEFLLMAATLTQIKSKMLLPVLNEDGDDEEEDPRMAIVLPLLEHMKIKDAAEALERREILDRDVFSRTTSLEDIGIEEEELISVSLFDLLDSFRKIISRIEDKTHMEIILETKNIEDRISEIIDLLKLMREAAFEKLFIKDRSRGELILTFLALLELARIGLIRIFQNQTTRDIKVHYVEESELAEAGESEEEKLLEPDHTNDKIIELKRNGDQAG